MQRRNLIASAVVAGAALTMSLPASAQDVLTGDTRLACEALLCLASGTRPSECAPSLARYFSISARRWSDTLRGRINFLNLCPAGSQTPQMSSLVNAIANGAGRCDAASLNQELVMWNGNWDSGNTYISNQLPDYCSAYINNGYTRLGDLTPKYVGDPMNGGYWVPANQYDAALAAYNAWLQQQQQQQQNNWGGGG
ncbi:MAG: conjugal transfer protein TrbM [Rhodoferax ferrireducens]|uniref:Conjugal transfer protein TrbM n=1 Tax=Rhodoferax ferrireducens TaxID=192843 RepID=A0A1W9KQ12_9BURK|nr:MAG: conjugal transfer protein TrbM [Rhodoferax ferrireducens]